jgi:hypothetical protein
LTISTHVAIEAAKLAVEQNRDWKKREAAAGAAKKAGNDDSNDDDGGIPLSLPKQPVKEVAAKKKGPKKIPKEPKSSPPITARSLHGDAVGHLFRK